MRYAFLIMLAAVTLVPCAIAQQPASPTPAPKASSQPVRVGSAMMQGSLIKRVNPVYPIGAIANRIEGAVILSAVISTEGRIKQLYVVSGPQELREAAADAVQQWQWKPYMLNGEPVEVAFEVNVNFTLR